MRAVTQLLRYEWSPPQVVCRRKLRVTRIVLCRSLLGFRQRVEEAAYGQTLGIVYGEEAVLVVGEFRNYW